MTQLREVANEPLEAYFLLKEKSYLPLIKALSKKDIKECKTISKSISWSKEVRKEKDAERQISYLTRDSRSKRALTQRQATRLIEKVSGFSKEICRYKNR